MIYGYARVSSQGQERYGNGLDVQKTALTNAGADVIYAEAYTGTVRHRPELDRLLSVLQAGDTLVVCKLDRIARNTREGIDIVESVLSKGAAIRILNMGTFDNSPTGRLTWQIFLAFAEFERNMIVERTTAGKQAAKEKDPNWRAGRKELEVDGLEEMQEKVARGEVTVSEACRRLGISRRTWYNRSEKEEGSYARVACEA